MRHMPLPLSSSLIIRSGFEPNFLMVDLCCEVKLSLVTCGGGGGWEKAFVSFQGTVLCWWSSM